jgi:hypothetical protein
MTAVATGLINRGHLLESPMMVRLAVEDTLAACQGLGIILPETIYF